MLILKSAAHSSFANIFLKYFGGPVDYSSDVFFELFYPHFEACNVAAFPIQGGVLLVNCFPLQTMKSQPEIRGDTRGDLCSY